MQRAKSHNQSHLARSCKPERSSPKLQDEIPRAAKKVIGGSSFGAEDTSARRWGAVDEATN